MPDSGTNSYAPQNFAWKVSGGAGAPLERSGAPLERAGAPEEAGDSPLGDLDRPLTAQKPGGN